MNVISRSGLVDLAASKPGVLEVALGWYRVAKAAHWTCFADVRKSFPDADLVGKALIFNIRPNRYRLITRVSFLTSEIYVKALVTHKEYDREEWKKWV